MKSSKTPKRIRLSRKKGWRKPVGAVVCSRPSIWGNPFPVSEWGQLGAVKVFDLWLEHTANGRAMAEFARQLLAGKNLCCWCGLDKPCHVDVLLRVANVPQPRPIESANLVRLTPVEIDKLFKLNAEMGTMVDSFNNMWL